MADLSVIRPAVELTVDAAGLLIGGKHSHQTALWMIEAAMIRRAIRLSHGNRSRAARLIHLPTGLFDYKMDQHALLTEMTEVEKLASRQFEMFGYPIASTMVQSISTAFMSVLQKAETAD